MTAQELAEELGYRFYGSTWKFSEPTFVRVRVWSGDGPAATTPALPPPDAQWSDVYTPDKPQSQLTVRVLQKNDEKSADGGKGEYTRIGMTFKIRASGKDAPAEGPVQIATVAGQPLTTSFQMSSGQGTTLNLDLVQGPHQAFNDEWRYANGSLGLVLEGFAKVLSDVAAQPDHPGQKEAAEATIREHVEAGLRAAPLNLVYYKGEVSGRNKHEEDKPGPYDVPRKRAVCLVTLECSREPFKPGTAATAPAGETQVAVER